jgi:hypothetical protein
MPKTIREIIAELCDGDENLPSREAIEIETLLKAYNLSEEN